MTPQKILEDMADIENMLGRAFFDYFDELTWTSSRELLKASTHFDFGMARPTPEHTEFGDELMAQGAFRLPFECVLYTGTAIPESAALGISSVIDGELKSFGWVIFGPAKTQQSGPTRWTIPLMACALEDDATGRPGSVEASTVKWKAITTHKFRSRTLGHAWGDAEYDSASAKALGMLLGGTALLMSREIGQRLDPPPSPKLQAKRAAQGKPPIYPRTVVFIRPEHRATFRNGEPGTHASPRMHWRRGHFRKLHGGERIIPVAPSLVGAGDAARPPVPKSYQLGGTANG